VPYEGCRVGYLARCAPEEGVVARFDGYDGYGARGEDCVSGGMEAVRLAMAPMPTEVIMLARAKNSGLT
jgi:hypothetical protein